MKLSYIIAVLICTIKTTLAGIEIPRDGCEWFSGTTYGVDIKCDGKYFEKSTIHPKLYIPSTLNIDLILWHTQLIVCAENVKSWFKSFTFQAYTLPHTLNCMCVSLFKFHI